MGGGFCKCSDEPTKVESSKVSHPQRPDRPAPEGLVVAGAGGKGECTNGVYRQHGKHRLRTKYKQRGGDGIIFFEGFWKLNSFDDTGSWLYSVQDWPQELHYPPEGAWTSCGSDGNDGLADPPPTVTTEEAAPPPPDEPRPHEHHHHHHAHQHKEQKVQEVVYTDVVNEGFEMVVHEDGREEMIEHDVIISRSARGTVLSEREVNKVVKHGKGGHHGHGHGHGHDHGRGHSKEAPAVDETAHEVEEHQHHAHGGHKHQHIDPKTGQPMTDVDRNRQKDRIAQQALAKHLAAVNKGLKPDDPEEVYDRLQLDFG